MDVEPSIAGIGALIGVPARASILGVLMDGRALTATELARCAGVSPQTTSSHLAKLTDAKLLVAERHGRHRYYRLADPAIADAIGKIRAAGKAAGILSTEDKLIQAYRDLGAGFIAVGVDTVSLAFSARDLARKYRVTK